MPSEQDPLDPCVSVIIPCHNAVDSLPIQLTALSKQSGAPSFEVLLVDNGRNAGLDALVDDWRQRLPHLRIIDATSHPGTAFARNRGAAAAIAEKLLFCDSDDAAMPDWVQTGSEVLDDLKMFSGAAIPLDESKFDGGYDVAIAAAGRAPTIGESYEPSGTSEYPVLMGATFGYRKDVFYAVGGFDAAFGALAEDNDLAFRTQAAGVPVLSAENVRLAYRVRSQDTAALRRAFRGGFAHARLCARHRAWSRSPSYHARLWQEPLRAIGAAIRGRLRQGPRVVQWQGRLGTSLGLLLGRLYFRLSPPSSRVGYGL